MKALEITSFVLGILAIAVSWLPIVNNLTIVLGGIAVILGAIYLIMTYRKKLDLRKGFATTGTVLGVISLVIMFATQSFYVSVLEETVEENTVSIEQAADEPQEEIFSLTDESYVEENYSTYVTGTITNNASKDWNSVSVSYDFYNADGVKIGSGSDYCSGLKAGESWKFKASYFGSEDTPTTYTFSEISYW